MKNVGIVGAGIGGLATSIRLACKGHQIDVFEANPFPGGKLSQFTEKGYRFDAGPSLFTMPHFVEELFSLAGKDIKSYFEYQKIEEVCHYFWDDGTTFVAESDVENNAKNLAATFGVDEQSIVNYFKKAKHKYDVTAKVFLHKSLHQPKNIFTTDFLKGVINIPSLDIFKSMNRVNESLKHPKVVQLFNRYATYNGSNPYKAPGILTSIPHLEHGIGTFFPKGGMYSITKALYQLALDMGVNFHFNSKVDEITIKNRRAKGLVVNDKTYDFDAVVSNMDVFFTYKKLLKDQAQPAKVLAQEKSSSALIFYWGIKQRFPQLGLHNILFSNDYKKEFETIFNDKTVDNDPTVYINITSKYQQNDAPNNGENWFVMVNVPYNDGQDWDAMIPTIRKDIIQKINKVLKTDIESLIECELTLEPRTIESRTSSHLGSLYGTSSNNRNAAFLRHPNFSRKIKDLYFCGGSVHPGGGIPLCLLSAKIVSEVFEE